MSAETFMRRGQEVTVWRGASGQFTKAPEITYVFVWHSFMGACPKCAELNGQKFEDQDLFANLLFDNTGKPIWNLAMDHSLAHGYGQFNCRCQLEAQINIDISRMDALMTVQQAIGDMS